MRRTALVVRVGGGSVRAEVVRAGTVIWAAETPYSTEADLSGALGALGAEPAVTGQARTVRVELERPLVQLRTLTDLPPVGGRALRALVAHQAGRFFRKNGKPLVTDAGWEPRRRGAPRIATAAAAEEPWLEAIVEGVRSAGLGLAAITPAGSRLLLLPGQERADRARAAGARVTILATVTAAIWIGVGGIAMYRLTRETARVERELARLAPAAAAARAVRRDVDEALGMIGVIEEANQRRAAVSARTARLLLALPDSTYLSELHVTDGPRGEVTGVARRAMDLVAALERSGAVVAPRLAGLTNRAPVGAREYERFTVRFGPDSAR